jgi:hypothetical protein
MVAFFCVSKATGTSYVDPAEWGFSAFSGLMTYLDDQRRG